MTVASLFAAAAFGAFGAPAAFAGTNDAHFEGASADGSVAVFSTAQSLVEGDTDSNIDLYVRSYDAALEEETTREVSIGPDGGNAPYNVQFDAISPDGAKVFFSTVESLVEEDGDHSEDVYVRDLTTNSTELVTKGEAACAAEGCGNGETASTFVTEGMAAEGNRIFFVTSEKLSSADTDGAFDIYMRDLSAGTTTLVSRADPSCSTGGCGNGSAAAAFKRASANGEKVVFTTTEALNPEDTDTSKDIYQRDIGAGTTALVSPSGTCPEGVDCNPTFRGASSDGSHVFFESSDRISTEDTDTKQDVYDWSGGAPALASIGAEGTGNGAFDVTFAGNSADGTAVYFQTSERLSSADTDSARDVYMRKGGVTTLVSAGDASCEASNCGNGEDDATLEWVSPNGSSEAVIFSSAEKLNSADEDSAPDLYERAGGETRLLTSGAAGGVAPALFGAASANGSRVFFTTTESLLPADEDGSQDVYEASGGEISLVSTGPVGGNSEQAAGLSGITPDGSVVFFVTRERLTEGDGDANEADVYSRSGGATLLVSRGNYESQRLGPPAPQLTGTEPASPSEAAEPKILGTAEAGSQVKLYTNSGCRGEPVGTGSAEELESPGIAVSAPAGPTSFWATAEGGGYASPCSTNAVTYNREAPPAEEEPGGSGGEEESGGGSGGSGGGGETGAEAGATEEGGSGGGTTAPSGPTYGPAAEPFVPPIARITYGPGFKTKRLRPVFRFADATGQPGTRFICKLDRRRWHFCESPLRLGRLHRGGHVLRVKAVNVLGVWETGHTRFVFKEMRGLPDCRRVRGAAKRRRCVLYVRKARRRARLRRLRRQRLAGRRG